VTLIPKGNRTMRAVAALVLLPLTFSSGCGDDAERPEVINKLRAIGVATDKPAIAPSTPESVSTATLTFVLAAPKGQTLVAEAWTDSQSRLGVPVTIAMQPETLTADTSFPGLDIWTVQAVLTAPPATALGVGQNFAKLRYAAKVTAGTESETIVGDLLMFAADAPELARTNLTVDIAAPGGNVPAKGESDLTANVTRGFEENVRIGWYVSAGQVKNRRARTTKWIDPGQGGHTVIVTARGLKSGSFSWKAVAATGN
jgi:hypothetical protein